MPEMSTLRWTSRLLAICSILALAACQNAEEPAASDGSFPTVKLGDQELTIELALTQSEQAKGLMFRDGIADDHGMLFVYKSPQRMSYWMKNVDFPIDIGFFTADGVLREVYPLYAQDTFARKSIRDDMLYALETRHEWFRDNDVRPGAQLDLDAVRAAVAAKQSQR